MEAAVKRFDECVSYERLVERFRGTNGFQKVGHKGYAVLTFIWEKAGKEGWPQKVELRNTDIANISGLRDTAELNYLRKRLIESGYLKDYVGPGYGNRREAAFFLNYNF